MTPFSNIQKLTKRKKSTIVFEHTILLYFLKYTQANTQNYNNWSCMRPCNTRYLFKTVRLIVRKGSNGLGNHNFGPSCSFQHLKHPFPLFVQTIRLRRIGTHCLVASNAPTNPVKLRCKWPGSNAMKISSAKTQHSSSNESAAVNGGCKIWHWLC